MKKKTVYVKDKKGLKLHKQMEKNKERYFKLFKPYIRYDSEYDIFFFIFAGKRKYAQTIELTDDIRFDLDKKLNIIAIEIEDFMSKLKIKKGNKLK